MIPGVTKGKLRKPFFLAVYGVEGVGKTTFAAEAPNPIFLGPERGSSELDVYRFPAPKNWFEFQSQLTTLKTAKHDFKTAVIDSLDWLEPMVFEQVMRAKNASSIDDGVLGYGKGHNESTRQWRMILPYIEALRDDKGMNVVLIAHAETVKFNDPQLNAEYNRYQMKLYKKSADLIKEAVDAVLFMNYEAHTIKDGQRMRAYGQNERVMYTERRPGFDAKNRFSLPATIPMIEGQMWRDFEAFARRDPEDFDVIMPRILELKSQILDADMLEKIEKSIADAKQDLKLLGMIEQKLILRLSESPKENA